MNIVRRDSYMHDCPVRVVEYAQIGTVNQMREMAEGREPRWQRDGGRSAPLHPKHLTGSCTIFIFWRKCRALAEVGTAYTHIAGSRCRSFTLACGPEEQEKKMGGGIGP